MKSFTFRRWPAILLAILIPALQPKSVAAQERHDARFIEQHVPTEMRAGESREVTITLRNTGTSTWTKEGQFKLTTQAPQDNRTWVGETRLYLDSSESIRPGETKTFHFRITAPREPGRYDFQWKMIHEGGHHPHRFGDLTPNVSIEVHRR